MDEPEASVLKFIRSVKEHGHGSVFVKVQKHHIVSVEKTEQNLI